MNTKTTFWSLFTTFWILGFITWFFQGSIKMFVLESMDANFTMNSSTLTKQFYDAALLSGGLLLLPFYFLLAHSWIKMKSTKQAWIFVLSSFVFGCIGYYLRMQLVISTVENTPTFDGVQTVIDIHQLKFEQYFFFGSILGCVVAVFWIWNANQKVTSKESGKL